MTDMTAPSPNEAPISEPAPRMRLLVLGLGGAFLLVLMFVFAWSLNQQSSDDLIGSPAPDFTLTTFEGNTVSLADLEGQIVVMNFWASWCVECYDEAPLLEEAYRLYKDQGVNFIGVAYLDTPNEALAYMDRYNITYPSGLDIGTKISEDYFITGVPETFILDEKGQIFYVHIGPINRSQLFELIDAALAQRTA